MSVGLKIWNVQHGSAAHIRTPNGGYIAVDCGSTEAGSPLLALKNQLGQSQLDMAIITHPHVDHISDILNLSPNPPKDTDGRREDSGRGWVRELQGRWPGVLG